MTLTDPGTDDTAAAAVPALMFNPFEPGFFDDPSVQLDALREQEPVHYMEFTGGYLLTRYDDVFRVLRDRSIGSEATHAIRTPSIEAELAQIAKDPSAGACCAWTATTTHGCGVWWHRRLRHGRSSGGGSGRPS